MLVKGKNLRCMCCKEKVEIAFEHIGPPEYRLCRRCAQHLMRILFEDIIYHDNGVHVSLLGIMYHGGADYTDAPEFRKYRPSYMIAEIEES